MARLYALTLVITLGLAAVPMQALSANHYAMGDAMSVTGSLDGLDLKTRSIWISDKVYRLERSVSVKGTSSKLGLITDLKQGETIKAYLKENQDAPSIPYVTRIERQ